MTQQIESNSNFRLRSTLFIGLGGSGHHIGARFKALLLKSYPPEQLERRVRLLVFDTAREDPPVTLNGQPITLEPGSEFFDIGHTPVANIKRNLPQQAAIAERMGDMMASLPPVVLRNGAKQLRPFGLLAFLWRYTEIEKQLESAIWSLAGRQDSDGREGINVVIVNSLGGGTGSSIFLDVAHVMRTLFDQLGNRADFCYITGIGLLPQAFPGVDGPNLIVNTVASLEELNHCMMQGGFRVRYPNGRLVTTEQPPFNIYYLVDGIDERGHTWRSYSDVCQLTAQAIFLQLGSQIGRKNENDFDNLDEVLVQQTDEGVGTYCGSFGLASLPFPAPALAETCTARLAIQVIDHRLLAPPGETGNGTQPEPPLDDLIQAVQLDPAHLAERLARDGEGLPLTVELTVPGWAARLSPAAAPPELAQHVHDYDHTRLGIDYKRWLNQHETTSAATATTALTERLHYLARTIGLLAVEQRLTHLLDYLDRTTGHLQSRQAELEQRQTALAQELGHLETVFLRAGESGFWGRKHRVAQAQRAYFATAQHFLTVRWQGQVTASTLAIFNRVNRAGHEAMEACRATITRLKTARRQLLVSATLEPAEPGQAGVLTKALATPAMVDHLFEQHRLPLIDIVNTLFSQQASPLDWPKTAPQEIVETLLAACRPAFTPVARMTVEDAIALHRDETSPEGYYRWLTEQATPSWNLDRTRLADGGSTLQRLEVLGVPDESTSHFHRHAAALVSTGDPTQIIAFVAHLGAPHTAIQQWPAYRHAYEQARGRVPLHVLPHFQTDNAFARQTFALGALFEFIRPTGAYFYYLPADALDRPRKLGQGLANTLEAFTQADGLIREVRERVDHVVARQGFELTLRKLESYYQTGNGSTDDLELELKRLVRAYADELRQIYRFAPGNGRPPEEPDPEPVVS